MAKVFTITEGLENLGALKSGGQGSVYKARRSSGLISAVKILPTPISSETDSDKNFTSFQNEVDKLKKVNETPNPHVVSIIASGITSTGNLPFIEMEYIEGPDLGELLTSPHDHVFTIEETIKVALQLSNALAHCHRADVKHGDIKSNNVKFNQATGNYMLLDFGLSVMSDEQRRTSIRYAGAIEFMAPEQSAGETLFETDVYSFGIILFELLAGTVPFPLSNKGEMARNTVMVAHMENPVPDLLSFRRNNIPVAWEHNKKEKEMQVPAWLLQLIARCLAKVPADRFNNGISLQQDILAGMHEEDLSKLEIPPVMVTGPVEDMAWKQRLHELEAQAIKHEQLINELKYQVENKDRELYRLNMALYERKPVGISRSVLFTVCIIAIGLGGYAMYDSLIKPYQASKNNTTVQANKKENAQADSSATMQAKLKKRSKSKPKKKTIVPIANDNAVETGKPKDKKDEVPVTAEISRGNKYRIKRNAFFYTKPDKHTRNNNYLSANSTTLISLQEQADFIFVELTDIKGKTTQTWLAKEDLDLVKK